MPTTVFDPATSTDTDLITHLVTTHDTFNQHHAGFIVSLAEFDHRGLYRACGAVSTTSWLGRRLNIARSTAYAYLQVSLTLTRFPLATDAFRTGALTYSQIKLLCRYLTADNEAELVKKAVAMSVRELELALAGHPDTDEDSAGRSPGVRVDRLEIWTDHQGRYRIDGDLSPAIGAQLAAAIKLGELATYRDLADVDPAELADDTVLDELLDAAETTATQGAVPYDTLGQEPAGGAGGAVGDKGYEQSSPDAGPGAAGDAAATDSRGPAGGVAVGTATRFGPAGKASVLSGFLGMINLARTSTTSAQVHVVVTEDGHPFMPLNPAAPATALAHLVTDGQFRGYLLDSCGVTLAMGRKRRLVTASQELAVLVAWLFQCAVPGCAHTRFLEFHHILAWSEGGRTDVGNLLPLCSGCHALVTSGQIRITPDPVDAHRLVFAFADGTVFVSVNRGLPTRVEDTAASAQTGAVPRHAAPVDRGLWDEDPTVSFGDDDDPADPVAPAKPVEPSGSAKAVAPVEKPPRGDTRDTGEPGDVTDAGAVGDAVPDEAAPQEKSPRGDTRDTGEPADPAKLSPRGDTDEPAPSRKPRQQDPPSSGEPEWQAPPAEPSPGRTHPPRSELVLIFDGKGNWVPEKSLRGDIPRSSGPVEEAVRKALADLA